MEHDNSYQSMRTRVVPRTCGPVSGRQVVIVKRAVWIVGALMVATYASLVSAQQLLSLAPGERYVLVPNGAKRTTDNKGGAQIRLENRQTIHINAAGDIEIRDVRDRLRERGRFLRWQGLSAGRIQVRAYSDHRIGGQREAARAHIRRHLRVPTGSQALIYR